MKERNRQGGSRGTRNPLYGAARDPLNGQFEITVTVDQRGARVILRGQLVPDD